VNTNLTGMVAIVTGGTRGIGLSIAIAFAERGANVHVLARGVPDRATTKSYLANKIEFTACDVSDEKSVKRTIENTIDKCGRIDFLINNAGIRHDAGIFETTIEDWEQVIRINLTGCFLMCKHALPHLIRKRRGRIINIASIVAQRGSPRAAAYGASKAGLVNLTLSIAEEVRGYGIRVYAICPGPVNTRFISHLHHLIQEPLLSPERVAEAVIALALDGSSWDSGKSFYISTDSTKSYRFGNLWEYSNEEIKQACCLSFC